MSILRYCCFRWLVYDRALVFEPSRPLACVVMLVWLILFVELCCDIFPWFPDLDRTHLRAWLVYGQIGGVTSWYQSQVSILGPVGYGPTSPLGGIRIFYSLSILWDSDLSSIRVKWILLNLTLGSRYHFHPESPLLLMIVCCTWRPWRYSPLITRELVFIAFAIPFHR